MAWWDFFKLFDLAFKQDPLTQARRKSFGGAGHTSPDAIPNLRGPMADYAGGGGLMPLRDPNEFVDLSSVTNRQSRYKEYDRLRNVAEIESVMTILADEACLAGKTLVSTPAFGQVTLEWLAENKADERFLVYCWDFDKKDYTLGWAYAPRKTKKAKTIKVYLDNGQYFICTPDHKILTCDAKWKMAGELVHGDLLMPFYHIRPKQLLTNITHNQFPRVFTFSKGWIHERQFIDEWKLNEDLEDYKLPNKATRTLGHGLTVAEAEKMLGISKIELILDKIGFSVKETRWLSKQKTKRRVVGVAPHEEIDVYDMSVEHHKNFATNWGIVHNCQKGENNRIFEVKVKNEEVKKELDFLFFHRKMLNMDHKKCWNINKQLYINGDFFFEIILNVDNPKYGISDLQPLPADSMYRIETTKGRLVEFQQSKEGPDYQSLARVEVSKATDAELQQGTAIRFTPEQVIHFRIGDDRKTFYPYGVSLIEAARGPAHQLRLMEDAMVVYRLSRAPERRVFYIDIGNLAPYRAEAFMERLKDQFRKKKVTRSGDGRMGASAVEERWHAPAADEDYWIPIRPNTNTRIETLPGAANLGEVDDAVYFRNKLFTALNFPKNYFNQDDPGVTRITLSAQDVKFARMIERLQAYFEDGLWQIADRHLRLLGYPEETYEDLDIKMTPPSDWRELSRAEVINNRISVATQFKGSQLMPDYDILVDTLKISEMEAKEKLARLKIQKLDDLKMQILAQNPILLGVGLPGPAEEEVGTGPEGPSPMLGGKPEEQESPESQPPGMPSPENPPGPPNPENKKGPAIAEPEEDDIKKYNLDIKGDQSREKDEEDIDYSQLN